MAKSRSLCSPNVWYCTRGRSLLITTRDLAGMSSFNKLMPAFRVDPHSTQGPFSPISLCSKEKNWAPIQEPNPNCSGKFLTALCFSQSSSDHTVQEAVRLEESQVPWFPDPQGSQTIPRILNKSDRTLQK